MESIITKTVEALESQQRDDNWRVVGAAPSVESLTEVIDLISELIFPEYLTECRGEMVRHHLSINLNRVSTLIHDQIERAMNIHSDQRRVDEITAKFIESLPEIKSLLTTDVQAIYMADPAASSYAEIVLCYPTIVAITHHRIAHSLYQLGVPIIPRIIAEIAHSKTGIDIHPGATIGGHFAIDHGTGVVIGETTIIGEWVVIYQGVTLGAKGFRFDDEGNALNIPRHPIIGNNVRIYSNSSILGRITIGDGAVIGGNMWIDRDVAPGTTIVRER